MIMITTLRKGQVLLAVLSILVIGTKGFAPRGVGHNKHEIISPSRTKTTIVGGTIITALTSSSSSDDGRHEAAAARPSSTRKDDTEEEEEEWHPMDMAQTTPQLLSALWFLIAQGSTMIKGESSTLIFPQMQNKFSPSYLNRLMGHFDSCKDVCDVFGTKTVLVPHVNNKLGKMTGFTVKSYRNPDEMEEEEFPYDPFWDDGVDWNHEGVDDDDEEEDGSRLQDYPEIVDKVPDDDDTIIATTKVWVDKLMSDMGICPFTSGPNMAGLPMGPVLYAVERCTSMEDMYARYWKEVVRVEQQSEKELSTTLLIAPEFCLDDIELFENFSNTLTQPLVALGIEDLIQLVFFHPQWTFRDGGERSFGSGAAANYARRSPWPMINILRTKQVRTAQRGIPTGLVYKQNEKTLNEIGAVKLETMLRLRDWSDIADITVNRRDMEALRVAQDFQQTGSISTRDTSFEYDSTPAANRVDSSQMEGGNLVNVLRDALNKRLGLKDGTTITPLSGPETSVTMMASDFLLQELNRIAESSSDRNEPTARMSEAERMILQDMEPPDMDEEEELNVLFGGGGIPMGDDDEDDNFTGVNAIAFY